MWHSVTISEDCGLRVLTTYLGPARGPRTNDGTGRDRFRIEEHVQASARSTQVTLVNYYTRARAFSLPSVRGPSIPLGTPFDYITLIPITIRFTYDHQPRRTFCASV